MNKKAKYIPGDCHHPSLPWAEFIKEWARMIRTHRQEACSNCGVYNIWRKK